MINRAREIGQMMGYTSIDAILEAIGSGELALIKLSEEQRLRASEWLRDQIVDARAADEALADTLHDIAQGLELAMELEHYPADTDVCDIDLPHGWPSYCEKISN